MKIFIILILLISTIFANSSIERFLINDLKKKGLNLYSLKVLEQINLKEIRGFSRVKIKYNYSYKKGYNTIVSQPTIVTLFTNGKLIAYDFFDINSATSIKNRVYKNSDRDIKKIKKYALEDRNSIIINLNRESKIYKPIMGIFIDPENIQNSDILINLNKLAKKYILNIIFTPFSSNSSLKKSSFIVSKLKYMKNDKEKIYLLKKFLFKHTDSTTLSYDFSILSGIKYNLDKYGYLKKLELPYKLLLDSREKFR